MIHKVILPKIEPNMEEAMVVEWLKKENEPVKKGEPLFVIETAKAAIEVEAEEPGILKKILVKEGQTVPVLTIIALMGEKDDALPEPPLQEARLVRKEEVAPISRAIEAERIKASPSARRLAREDHARLEDIKGTGPEGRIVEEDVKRWLKEGKERILIIGAGDGAEVVADLLSRSERNQIVGYLDDNEKLWGKEILGRTVLGKLSLAEEMKEQFDSIIISITSNMKIRKLVFENLKAKGFRFINAIHPQAYVNPSAEIGVGNIIGAFVHVGYGTRMGDNCLVSAHCDIEHHNRVGSHVLFGPGVMTSGRVSIGDLCSLGAGVNIEPHVQIGENVAIASGSTIIRDIPPNTTVKAEIKLH